MTTRLTSSPILDDLDAFLGRGDFIASVFGGLVGHWYLSKTLTQFFLPPRALDSLLGAHAYGITLAIGVLCSMVLAFCAVRLATNLRFFFGPEPLEIQERPEAEFSETNYELDRRNRNNGLYLGEIPSDETRGRILPEWLILSWKAIVGNFLFIGGIGGGKTTGGFYPLLEQIIARGSDAVRKTAILLLDKKGTVLEYAIEVATRFGRESDIVVIGIPTDKHPNVMKWNPFKGRASHQISEDVLSNGEEGSSDNDGNWIKEFKNLVLPAFIDFLRLVNPGVEISNLHLDALLKSVLLVNTLSSPDSKIAQAKADMLEEYRLNFYARADWKEQEALYLHCLGVIEAFANGNEKNNATVVASTLTNIAPFVYPGAAEAFCPTAEEDNFPGIEQLLNTGAIVTIQAGGSHPQLATSAGRMFKRAWQEAILTRVQTDPNPPPAAMFIDECQSFLDKARQQGSGDMVFLNQSRESNHSTFLFTQSFAFLESELGGKLGARLVAAGCRSKIFLGLTDYADQKQASDQLNDRWVDVRSEAFVERPRKGSSLNVVLDRVDGQGVSIDETHSYKAERRKHVEPEQLANLPNFEAWASIYDGTALMPPTKLFLKPSFLPFETAHFEVRKILREEGE